MTDTTNDHVFAGWDDDSETIQINKPDDSVDKQLAQAQKEREAAEEAARLVAYADSQTVTVGGTWEEVTSGRALRNSAEARWGAFVTGVDELGGMIAVRDLEPGAAFPVIVYQAGQRYGVHRDLGTAEAWLRGELAAKRKADDKRKKIEEGGPKIIEAMALATDENEREKLVTKAGMVAIADRVTALEAGQATTNVKLDLILAKLDGN